MKKRILIILMSMVMVIGIMPTTVGAAIFRDWIYTPSNGIIENYFGTDAVVSIPLGLSGTTISRIGPHAFDGNGLQSINIHDGIIDITDNPFENCPNLNTITVADGNTNYCAVNNVLMSKDQTVLRAYPGGITATSYTEPSTVKEISESSFTGNSYLQ